MSSGTKAPSIIPAVAAKQAILQNTLAAETIQHNIELAALNQELANLPSPSHAAASAINARIAVIQNNLKNSLTDNK